MTDYIVSAFDANGRKVKKIINARDTGELTAYAAHCRLSLLSFRPASRLALFFRRRKKIKTDEVIEILESLHLVIKSGIPLNTGLREIAEDSENSGVSDVLNMISFRTEAGSSFSKAAESRKDVFGETVLSLIRIGEETGMLDKTLKDAANHVTQVQDLKSKTLQALLYPMFALTALFGALVFWLAYVMPKMAETFAVFDMELPLITRSVMGVSYFVRDYMPIFLLLIAASAVIFTYMRKNSPTFRLKTDKALLRLPVAGALLYNYNLAFFAEYIRLMTSAGLPLFKSLTVMEESFESSVFRQAVTGIKEEVSRGGSFSAAMGHQNLFPPLLVRMVKVGEKTGHLTDRLAAASEYYFAKTDRTARNISKVLEPAIIGFVGLFMLIIFVGLLSPVFGLISGIS